MPNELQKQIQYEQMVQTYLTTVSSLQNINTLPIQEAKNYEEGLLLLSIKMTKMCIDELIVSGFHSEAIKPNKEALCRFRKDLDKLPSSTNIKALKILFQGIDKIQKNIMQSIQLFLDGIKQPQSIHTVLKWTVLVLKITEDYLTEKEGPIEIGHGLFKVHLLSDHQRKENLNVVQGLLKSIVGKFDISAAESNRAMCFLK